MHADAEDEAVGAVERDLGEARVGEPLTHLDRAVGRTPMAGPDHGRVGRAERRQDPDRPLDVRVGDVAEHAARDHDLGGNRAAIRVGLRRVGGDHLDFGRGGGSGGVAVARVELDEPGAHVGGAGMAVDRADQVPALTGADADDPDRPRRARIERRAQVALHDGEPALQRAARTRRTPVPGDPIVAARGGRRVAQPASAFSIESTTSGASGSTSGEKRAITLPSRPTRNFSKFQRMSPVWPSASGVSVSAW